MQIFKIFRVFKSAFFLASGQKKLKEKKLKNSKTQGKKLKLKPNSNFSGIVQPKFDCSGQNFAKVVINFENLPNNSMKFCKNSRILQKLKPKNSISGISKIFRYPESGQKKGWYNRSVTLVRESRVLSIVGAIQCNFASHHLS